MDTLYYRKIAEIIRRDEQEPALRAVAERALSTPRDGKSRIAKADRRTLKTWMRRWCDERAAPPGDQSDGR